MNARIVLPLVVALFAIGCGDDDEKTSKEEGTKQRPREARTFEEWKQINPKLSQYVALNEEFVPTMGIHWGVMGPHLTVAVGEDDIVTAVEIIIPAADGWEPWFDQPEGEPDDLPGLGEVYTQHIWITDIETVNEGQTPTLLPLTLDALKAANPGLADYQQLSDYVPQMGIHHGIPGPSVVIAAEPDGKVNAFEIIIPEAQGWFPWFDQPEGEPMEMEGLGLVYTQHLYVVEPSSLD